MKAKERAFKKVSSRFPGTRCFHFRWCIGVSDVCPGARTWAPESPGRLHVAQRPCMCARLSPRSGAAHRSTLDQLDRTLLQALRAGWEAGGGLGRGGGPAVPLVSPVLVFVLSSPVCS